MRIVHVLSYVSEDGSYGGPVAVAVAQCRALAERGHHVTLLAGWDGKARLNIPGVDVRLHRIVRLPGLGFGGLVAPSLWWDLRRRTRHLDVAHFHFARDFVQLPAAALVVHRVRSLLQPHGMVLPDARFSARLIDALLTRRVCRGARSIAVLTDNEQEAVSTLTPSTRVVRIRNGVELPTRRAQWRAPATVLFLARLHARKRPIDFVHMAARVVAVKPDTTFLMVGPDEGMAEAVDREIDRLGLRRSVIYRGPVSPAEVSSILSDAQVYVLPSVEEPFPMSVLEALAHGLPTVVTTETGISAELAQRLSASVSPPGPGELAESVIALLDEKTWESQSHAARADAEVHFSMAAVADTLESEYQR